MDTRAPTVAASRAANKIMAATQITVTGNCIHAPTSLWVKILSGFSGEVHWELHFGGNSVYCCQAENQMRIYRTDLIMEELKLMVPCLMGLEKIVSDELRRLGMGPGEGGQRPRHLYGHPGGHPPAQPVAALWARVLLVLAEFPARSFEELFQGSRPSTGRTGSPRTGSFR